MCIFISVSILSSDDVLVDSAVNYCIFPKKKQKKQKKLLLHVRTLRTRSACTCEPVKSHDLHVTDTWLVLPRFWQRTRKRGLIHHTCIFPSPPPPYIRRALNNQYVKKFNTYGSRDYGAPLLVYWQTRVLVSEVRQRSKVTTSRATYIHSTITALRSHATDCTHTN